MSSHCRGHRSLDKRLADDISQALNQAAAAAAAAVFRSLFSSLVTAEMDGRGFLIIVASVSCKHLFMTLDYAHVYCY